MKLQEKRRETIEARYKPKLYTMTERRRFAVQGLPGMGPKLADIPLRTFGSVHRVFAVTKNELIKVEGFRKKRAGNQSVLDAPYITERYRNAIKSAVEQSILALVKCLKRYADFSEDGLRVTPLQASPLTLARFFVYLVF